MYGTCLKLAADCSWRGMSCDECPVHAAHGVVLRAHDRKAKITELASCRELDEAVEDGCGATA
jgi:hypothetical protein